MFDLFNNNMCYQIFKCSHLVAITPQTTVIKTFKQKTSLKPEDLGKKLFVLRLINSIQNNLKLIFNKTNGR